MIPIVFKRTQLETIYIHKKFLTILNPQKKIRMQ